MPKVVLGCSGGGHSNESRVREISARPDVLAPAAVAKEGKQVWVSTRTHLPTLSRRASRSKSLKTMWAYKKAPSLSKKTFRVKDYTLKK